MKFIDSEVKAYERQYVCPHCDVGYLKNTGMALMSNPPQYVHICTHCDKTTNVRGEQYPKIIYK